MKVIASCPTRVDIVGGTLDLWPIHNLLAKKATVNVAIDLRATATVTISSDKLFHFVSKDQNLSESGDLATVQKSQSLGLFGLLLSSVWNHDLPAITLETEAKSPAGAGLGGSSALSIAVLKALSEARARLDQSFTGWNEDRIVRTAQDVESVVIHAPTGVQDYWGAVRGGVNILTYPFGTIDIETLRFTGWEQSGVALICCYSGKSRASAINNWEIFKRIFDGDKQLQSKMSDIGSLSHECALQVKANQWREAVFISKKEWDLRVKLWPGIETAETTKLHQAAIDSGALFSRVCGAGGGGVMAIFSPVEQAQKVKESLSLKGGQVLDAKLGGEGLTVSSS